MDRVFNLLQGQNVGETIGKVTVKDDEQEFVVCHLSIHITCFSGRSLAILLQNALILSV